MDVAQLGLGLIGISRDTGNGSTGQVHNGPLNQVENDADGAAEEGVANNAGGAEEGLDELIVGLGELYMTVRGIL